MIERYLDNAAQTGVNKYRYHNVYDKLIAAYNESPHSSLGKTDRSFMAPDRMKNAFVSKPTQGEVSAILKYDHTNGEGSGYKR